MLRLVHVGNALPISLPVSAHAEFQPGMVAQLGVEGNNQVCGVSDGLAPFGIIDDMKTRSFTAPSIDEVVIASDRDFGDLSRMCRPHETPRVPWPILPGLHQISQVQRDRKAQRRVGCEVGFCLTGCHGLR